MLSCFQRALPKSVIQPIMESTSGQRGSRRRESRGPEVPVPESPKVLQGVAVHVLMDAPAAAPVLETVRAFGGRVADDVAAATHVVVSYGLGPWELARYRGPLLACQASSKPVVDVSWLEEVVTSPSASPWDQALLDSHVPPGMADLTPASANSRPRRTDPAPLVGSLQETWQFLRREHPEEVEAGQLRVAIERSLLDCALALRRGQQGAPAVPPEAPERVLGVAQGARPEEVRAAYREKAKTAHPDKGGDPEAFCRLQQAYLTLTRQTSFSSRDKGGSEALLALPEANTKDFELREHRSLVESWFEQHGADLVRHVQQQGRALRALGLEVCDVGSVNRNEQGQEMRNQCFYLSLARSYLGSDSKKSPLEDTALHFKRVVESAVLAAHPDWGGSRVGEDVQAFSDFLFFVLGSHALLAELAVAVFDSVSGGVEVYKGKHYPGPEREAEQRSNLLIIHYVPGHYQALVPPSGRRPTLPELQRRLEEHGVLYVVTDG